MKKTRKSFVLSVLALLLCVAMLLGVTYAWFTDSASSGTNKIVAGNLDVDLVMDKAQNGNYTSIADEDAAIFGENSLVAQNDSADTLWEPGKTQIVYLGVQNKGSLALKYDIKLVIIDDKLASALDYAIIDGGTKTLFDASGISTWADLKAASGVQTGNLGDAIIAEGGAILAAAEGGILDECVNGTKDETDYFALAIHMREDAGNDYMEKNVRIDVLIEATQYTAESDSFDNQYDKDAKIVYDLKFDIDCFECLDSIDKITYDETVVLHIKKEDGSFGKWGWSGANIKFSVDNPENLEVGETFTITVSNPIDDVRIFDAGSCFVAGTKITMADGSEKNIEDICEGESVLTFNHETGKYEGQKVYLNEKSQMPSRTITLIFDDGTDISLYMHNFFEQESLMYVVIGPQNAEECIGKHYYSAARGEYVELVGVTYNEEIVDSYSLYTEYNMNSIANGMLTLPDDIGILLNIYEFHEDLTADAEALARDVEQYGWNEYSEDYNWTAAEFDAWRDKYAKILIGKGFAEKEDMLDARRAFLRELGR